MATDSTKPVLIAGGGPASLLFAQSLLRNKIPFKIFERDASLTFRAQGYRLRMSGEGLDAIEEVLGTNDGFPEFWDACSKTGGSKGFAHLDALTGEEPTEDASPAPTEKKPDDRSALPKESLQSRDGKTIGISRGDMRRIFMKGCEPYIEWSRNVTGYKVTESGVKATFADGTESEEGQLLVGGEGIYSKTARKVSDGKIKTYDTGARGIHGQAPSTAFKQLGEGVWRVSDESRPEGRVFAITNVRPGDMDDPEVQFGWTMGGQPGVIRPPNDDFAIVGQQAADLAKSLTENWHPKLRPLFEQMNVNEAAFWKITCSTPSGVPEWKNEPRVTVIGDAVHSMTPAGGIGANTAVRDSALLGRLVGEAGGYREGLTADYEKRMRVYASEAVGQSYGMATSQFGIKIEEGKTPTV